MSDIQGVAFDLYDTLTYSDKTLYAGKVSQCASWCGVAPEDFRRVWNSFVVESNLGRLASTADRVKRVLQTLHVEQNDRLIADIVSAEHEFLRTGIRLFDDVLGTLRELRERGFRLGLITNASKSVEIVIETTALSAYLDCIVVSSHVGVRKPAPAIFTMALEKLGLKAPACVFVGDGNDGELDGAHRVGMITVRIDRGRGKYVATRDSSLQSVKHTIRSLSQIWDVLRDEGVKTDGPS